MKMFRSCLSSLQLLVASLFVFAFSATAFAEPDFSFIPVVTISATSPTAANPASPGVFTVFRAGNTNYALNVYYRIGGTASNGVDYAQIGNWISIPAGVTSNSIPITPLNTGPSNVVKSVILQLAYSPLLTPQAESPVAGFPINYLISFPNTAAVFLSSNGSTNLPPSVRTISPANGAVLYAPVSVPLFAYANDLDGSVTSVEFFAGTNSLGLGQPVPLPTPLPVISGTNLFAPNEPEPPILTVLSSHMYSLVWTNAPVGNYVLTAVATDNGGATTVSDPVNLSVLPSPPPPTNTPIISIVATDPVAVEGTNFWTWPGETNSSPTWAAWPTAVCRIFTNSGPKTATFTVRRWGDTNNDLTVPYNIDGTATNGVDYVTLPGFVTIRAGERLALISIVPIDDGSPDVSSTVTLTLTASTNTPPDYLLGFQRRAAAVIIDSNGPPPLTGMLPDKSFHVNLPGPDTAWFTIQYSTNMTNWTAVCTNQVVNGSIDFVDPDASSNSFRFYRTVPLATPPPE